MDSHWSQIVGCSMGVGQHPVLDYQKPSFERGISGPLLQTGHHLHQTFYHRSLDGHSQFPPTIGQPERLAAGYWGGQVEIRQSLAWHLNGAWHLDVLPQSRSWQCSSSGPLAEDPN